MFRRHHALIALTATFATVLAAGCSDPEPATPQVILDSTIAPTGPSAQNCQETGTWFTMGNFGNLGAAAAEDRPPTEEEKPKPVSDGAAEQQGTADVECSVTSQGDAFLVAARATLSGPFGGSLTISGTFRTSGEQTNIKASFSRVSSGSPYKQDNCIVRYMTQFQGVASGRVWGEITCSAAAEEVASRVCEATAQFRFENCTQ